MWKEVDFHQAFKEQSARNKGTNYSNQQLLKRKSDPVLLNNFSNQDEILIIVRSLAYFKEPKHQADREMLKTNSRKLNHNRNSNFSGILTYPFIIRDLVQ